MNNIKHILVVINPSSGTLNKTKIPEYIAQYFDDKIYKITTVMTLYSGHAKSLAENAVKESYYAVICVGGDGSINEVAQVLAHTNTILGIIPIGSGNGFAYHLNLPVKNIRKSLDIIKDGHIIDIDVVQMNNLSFVSTAGVGLDADIADRMNILPYRGIRAYIQAAIQHIRTGFHPFDVRIHLQENSIDTTIYVCTVFNANQYGNNVGVFKQTSLCDGLFDVFMLTKLPRWKWPLIIFLLLIKKASSIKESIQFQASEFTLEIRGKKRRIQLDGDAIDGPEKLHFKIHKSALRVFVNPATINKL